jgi:hypothetical protein
MSSSSWGRRTTVLRGHAVCVLALGELGVVLALLLASLLSYVIQPGVSRCRRKIPSQAVHNGKRHKAQSQHRRKSHKLLCPLRAQTQPSTV